jgi:hypothetical protein
MWLSESARQRLRGSWADGFQRKALPLLLESEAEFSVLYSDKGRPNWSVARLLGCLLLQQLEDKSDQQILDSISFDVRYQYALGLPAEEAYLSRRSLVDFRSRLVEHDPAMTLIRAVFGKVCDGALGDLGLSSSEQRTDSTWITSNIRIRGRLGLFRQTVRHFVVELEQTAPSQFARLDPAIHSWHQSFDDSWEDARETKKQLAEISQLAQWLYELVQLFATDEDIRTRESYQLLARLLDEQCIVKSSSDSNDGAPDGSEPVRVTVHKALRKSGGAMRSVHDPDAATGHKGVGYHVHCTETCNNEGPEIITHYEVVPANVPDTGRATGVLQTLEEQGRRPEILYVDGGYPTPDSLAQSEALGTELRGPVHRASMPAATMTRLDFQLDHETGRIVSCPQGHAPRRHAERRETGDRASLHAFFSADQCSRCPVRTRCPVRSPGKRKPAGDYRLELGRGLYLRDHHYREQQHRYWKDNYKIRSGVEATMSELKRAHGLGRLRVRRAARVELAVACKMIACNVKRWVGRIVSMGHAPQPHAPAGPGKRAPGASPRATDRLWSFWSGSTPRYRRADAIERRPLATSLVSGIRATLTLFRRLGHA